MTKVAIKKLAVHLTCLIFSALRGMHEFYRLYAGLHDRIRMCTAIDENRRVMWFF